MKEDQILKKLEDQEQRLERIEQLMGKLKTYFLWALIITIVVVVLPLIGLVFAIPQVLSYYSSIQSLGI